MRLLIHPNDVLMFRESRQFDAGVDHLARSMLPFPQSIAGAIRSKILARADFSEDAKHLVGFEEEEPAFEVLGAFFWNGEELFRVPKDVGNSKNDAASSKDETQPFYIEPEEMRWGKRELTLFSGKSIHFKSENGFISRSPLVRYLRGELAEDELSSTIVKDEDVFKHEGRVGVGIGDTKTAEEHLFYKAEFLRLEKGVVVSVWLGEKGNDVSTYLGEEGLLKLGGEGRFASYTADNVHPLHELEAAWEKMSQTINERKRFKLYIATPTLLDKADDMCTWNIKDELKEKLDVKIIKVYPLMGRPQKLSGWSYVKRKPKPLRYAVPRGSIYFVKFGGTLGLSTPYLKLGELPKLGYGLTLVGVW